MTEPRVTITCDDAHHDAPLVLYTFVRETHEARRWPLLPAGWREETVLAPAAHLGGNVLRVRRRVAGVSLDDQDRIQSAEDGPMGRERYRLACEGEGVGCGDVLTVRHERLVPVLDRLHDAGASSLTLRGLRAILR